MVGRRIVSDFQGNFRRLTKVPTRYLSEDAERDQETAESDIRVAEIQIQHLLNTY
jgi:hypothetical protein